MFSHDTFQSISLIGLALAARRIAAGIMRGDVEVVEIGDPNSYWAGSAHPERGYTLLCRGSAVADIVELGGRAYADWTVHADPEGEAAFRSALTAEADAVHAVARAVRSIEDDGGFIDGAGENVASRAPGGEPVAWLDYEDDFGRRDRVYFHGAAEVEACLRWARAHDLMEG